MSWGNIASRLQLLYKAPPRLQLPRLQCVGECHGNPDDRAHSCGSCIIYTIYTVNAYKSLKMLENA